MRKWALASVALACVGLGCGGSSSGGAEGGPGMDGGGGKDTGNGKDSKPPKDVVGPDDTGGGTDGSSPGSACDSYATNWCDWLDHCAKVAVERDYGTKHDCEKAITKVCDNEQASKGSGWNESGRQKCADALASPSSWACSDFLNGWNPPAACAPPVGNVPDMKKCGFDSDCASGFCEVAPRSSCGHCATAPVAGDACDKLAHCPMGLECMDSGGAAVDGGGKPQVCVKTGGMGDACGPSETEAICGHGFDCVGAKPKTATQGTCQPYQDKEGKHCSPGEGKKAACDPDQGLACDKPTKKCVAVPLAKPGDACGGADDVSGICTEGSSCSGHAKTPGTCTAAVADKGTCQLHGGPACAPLERCIVPHMSSTGKCEFDQCK